MQIAKFLRAAQLVLCILAVGPVAFCEEVSYFAPINANLYRAVLPGGNVQRFERDATEPTGLIGENGWIGELQGKTALLMSEDGRNGFRFVQGILANKLVNGQDSVVQQTPSPLDAAAFAAMWQPTAEAQALMTPPSDIWAVCNRFRLWYNNPNLAAVLLTEIAILGIGLCFLRRKWWLYLLGASVFLPSVYFLIKTDSRGGFLALVVGMLCFVIANVRALLKPKVLIAVLLAVAAVVGIVWASGTSGRYTEKFLTQNADNNRLDIWSEVPRMMMDSPCGWGIGNSGKAYILWYQKKNTCLLTDMISAHLTRLVEFGWCGRFLYIFGWVTALWIVLRLAFVSKITPPFALLSAYGVSGVFNPVQGRWELFALPLAAFLLSIFLQRHESRYFRIPLLVAALVAVCMLGGIYIFARSEPSVVHRSCHARTIINGTKTDTWLVDDNYTLHGGYWWLWGREVRDFVASHKDMPSFGIVSDIKDVPQNIKRLVLVGRAANAFLDNATALPAADEIILISPSFTASRVAGQIKDATKFRMYQGSVVNFLAAEKTPRPAWLKIIPGSRLYLPNWISITTNQL